MLLFLLFGLLNDVLHRHAPPGVNGDAAWQGRNLRRVKYAGKVDKVIADLKLLCPFFPKPCAGWSAIFSTSSLRVPGYRYSFHRLQKAGRALPEPILLIDLRLQGGDHFKGKLFAIIPFGNHHKPLVREFSADVSFADFDEQRIRFTASGQHGVDSGKK